jgi:hypothetical protein
MAGNDFMFTVAGQKLLANIASIAQSLRVIAEAVKERNEIKEIKEEK